MRMFLPLMLSSSTLRRVLALPRPSSALAINGKNPHKSVHVDSSTSYSVITPRSNAIGFLHRAMQTRTEKRTKRNGGQKTRTCKSYPHSPAPAAHTRSSASYKKDTQAQASLSVSLSLPLPLLLLLLLLSLRCHFHRQQSPLQIQTHSHSLHEDVHESGPEARVSVA